MEKKYKIKNKIYSSISLERIVYQVSITDSSV